MLSEALIETPRLCLRNLQLADIGEAYLSWLRDPEVLRYLEIRFSGKQNLDDLVTFVNGVNASADTIMFGIFRKDDGRHIGNVKLGPIIKPHARAEIGFLIGDRPSWGQGYASEAIRATARFGLSRFGLAKITSGCYETNIGSRKALLKAGFSLVATIPNDVVDDGCRVASLLFGMNA